MSWLAYVSFASGCVPKRGHQQLRRPNTNTSTPSQAMYRVISPEGHVWAQPSSWGVPQETSPRGFTPYVTATARLGQAKGRSLSGSLSHGCWAPGTSAILHRLPKPVAQRRISNQAHMGRWCCSGSYHHNVSPIFLFLTSISECSFTWTKKNHIWKSLSIPCILFFHMVKR